jgi:hypothetical protein
LTATKFSDSIGTKWGIYNDNFYPLDDFIRALLANSPVGIALISAGLACAFAIQDIRYSSRRCSGVAQSHNLFAIKNYSKPKIKKPP